MKIYTKYGDSGKTGLLNDRVSKTNIRIEVNGQIDELLVLLAFLIEEFKNNNEKICDETKQIYKKLFTISTIIADIKNTFNYHITDDDIKELENSIDNMSEQLPQLKNFIYYTGSKLSMKCHYVRTKVRSVERIVVRLFEEEEIDNNVLIYINRLSDYFYALARYINLINGVDEDILKL